MFKESTSCKKQFGVNNDLLCNFYLQAASALVCAAVPKSFLENILQAPLRSRSSSPDNSTSDVKIGQGYAYCSSLLACVKI
jgi:hypothetical protein